jgi:hypothetical protein
LNPPKLFFGLRIREVGLAQVVHRAVGVADPALLLAFFSQKVEKASPFTVVQENPLLPITSGAQMIHGSSEF